MSAIVGESLFYEASRVLRSKNQISYYQFKALEALIEIISLHDRVALFVGEETDSNYLKVFDWLITEIHDKSDFKIDIVTPKQRGDYITAEVMKRFEEVSNAIYPHALGITSDQLFGKQKKDRTAEDMSERIEQLFSRDYPEFDCKKFGEEIYDIWQKNATSSELLYLFRAHLIQAIAEIKNITPIYENQRLIASIAQRKCRKESKIGTLPYEIYKTVNKLFVRACETLSEGNIKYPRKSILMDAMIENASARDGILNSIVALRNELKDYRQAYRKDEEVLKNEDTSLSERAEIRQTLTLSANEIWMPVISSLGRNYTINKVKKVAKGIFGKYGIGELKYEHSEKSGKVEDVTKYSTSSLIGIGTATIQTLYEVHKDSKLLNHNKPLLDTLLRVTNMTGINQKLLSLLPVRDFGYRTPRLIDSLLVEE